VLALLTPYMANTDFQTHLQGLTAAYRAPAR
jgi:hypothetical protein